MLVNTKTIKRFTETLFDSEEEQQNFIDQLNSLAKTDTRCLIELQETEATTTAPFITSFVKELRPVKPGEDPDHQAGKYYILDKSSALLASAVLQTGISPETILDFCAAPGGKSIFLWKAFNPSILVANEVENSRIPALISNLKRCKISRSYVTCMRPEQFFICKSAFDLIFVDAPCSGQSMVTRGKQYSSAFHKNITKMNAMRQRRILAQAVPLLAPGATLAYTTCTYSLDENEKIVAWILKSFPNLEAIEIKSFSDMQSKYSEMPCYRVHPSETWGAGGFTALFRNNLEGQLTPLDIDSLKIAWKLDRVESISD